MRENKLYMRRLELQDLSDGSPPVAGVTEAVQEDKGRSVGAFGWDDDGAEGHRWFLLSVEW